MIPGLVGLFAADAIHIQHDLHRSVIDGAEVHDGVGRIFYAGADAAEAGYEAHAEEAMREGLRLKEGCRQAFLDGLGALHKKVYRCLMKYLTFPYTIFF
jgi:hypothetical protein